jgi:hypothetical protein
MFLFHRFGDHDEIRLDRRRRHCRSRFRNSGAGAGRYLKPRLLCPVLPERKLPKPRSRQSIYGWRLLSRRQVAERERYDATSFTASRTSASSALREPALQIEMPQGFGFRLVRPPFLRQIQLCPYLFEGCIGCSPNSFNNVLLAPAQQSGSANDTTWSTSRSRFGSQAYRSWPASCCGGSSAATALQIRWKDSMSTRTNDELIGKPAKNGG